MGLLGDLIVSGVERNRQAAQDRAALTTLAQFANDQNDQQSDAMAQRGKQAQALRNVLKSYSPDDPDVGHVLNGMGVDQLEGIMHGLALNSAMQQADTENAIRQAQAQWYQQRTQESADEGDATGQLLRRYGQIMNGGISGMSTPGAPPLTLPDTTLSLTPPLPAMLSFANTGQGSSAPAIPTGPSPSPGGALLQAFGDVSQMNPREGAALMKTFAPYIMGNQGEDLTPGIFSDPDTGADFVYRGKQLLPAGFRPSVTNAGKPVPQIDEDGNVLGWTMTDVRGHSTFHPNKSNATVKQLRDQDGNPVSGYYTTTDGRTIDARTAMAKGGWEMVRDADGNMKMQLVSNAPTQPPPVPAEASDRVAGTVYSTPKGNYKWTGTGWVKP